MKIFVVNLNDCLKMSQYEPFFYEHIHKEDLVLLKDPKDTYYLKDTYEQIMEHINQRPFSFKEAAIFLFIPRDFSVSLKHQDYELYNDINVYMHLQNKLPDSFCFYTFYVDKTGELEDGDAIYNKLHQTNDSMSSSDECMEPYCIDFSVAPSEANYKEYLKQRIASLDLCMQEFYQHVLENVPDINGDAIAFKNGINYFISQCKEKISGIKHAYAQIVRDDISKEIEEKLKIVYYIKSLTDKSITLENLPEYADFESPDYEHIKRLLATYRKRLSVWYGEPCPIERIGHFSTWNFHGKIKAAADFDGEVNAIVNNQLQALKVENIGSMDVVDEVFNRLDVIVSTAQEKLELFAHRQAQEIFDPNYYHEDKEESFDLGTPPAEDEIEEKKQLEKLNRHSPHKLPGFADENRLGQDLDIINSQINRIFEKLKVYTKKSFLLSLLFCVLAVVGLYFGTQYSVFIKEHTWLIFGGYTAAITIGFSLGYTLVKNRYRRQISSLLLDCKQLVEDYLEDFKKIAQEFETNLLEARQYYCLKKKLDQKDNARREYEKKMDQYSWHMMKVDDLLKNLSFFNSFIGDAYPYEEASTAPKSFNHDSVHMEFYQLKVF